MEGLTEEQEKIAGQEMNFVRQILVEWEWEVESLAGIELNLTIVGAVVETGSGP